MQTNIILQSIDKILSAQVHEQLVMLIKKPSKIISTKLGTFVEQKGVSLSAYFGNGTNKESQVCMILRYFWNSTRFFERLQDLFVFAIVQ